MADRNEAAAGEQLCRVLNVIADIIAVCRREKPSRETYEGVLRLLKKVVAFDAATVYTLNPGKDKFEPVASLGGVVELLSFLEFDRGDGLAGWAAHQKKPVLLSERSSNSRFNPQEGYATFLSVPLQVGDEVVAIINLGCSKPNALDQTDVKLMTAVGNQMALAFEMLAIRERCTILAADFERTHKELDAARSRSLSSEAANEIQENIALTCNEINNSLSVIIGNIECLLMEKAAATQKSLSRLRHIGTAAARIGDATHEILKINGLVSERSTDHGGSKASKTKKLLGESA